MIYSDAKTYQNLSRQDIRKLEDSEEISNHQETAQFRRLFASY